MPHADLATFDMARDDSAAPGLPPLPARRRARIRASGVVEGIRAAAVEDDDAERAVGALLARLDPTSLAGLIFFASGELDLAGIARAFQRRDLDIPVAGCTSAGEIAPDGLRTNSITAIGLPAAGFFVDLLHFDGLDRFDPPAAQARIREALARSKAGAARHWGAVHQAAIILVDGLSLREELVAAAIQEALGDVPLVGGSAGDGLTFSQAFVYHAGSFRRNSAVLLLLTSAVPMRAFRRQHARATGPHVVVTRADPDRRIVHELNAAPAAQEYARLIGVRPEELGVEAFALHPLLVRSGGEFHVRSVQRAHEDSSLSFYCAIDNGLVLTLGEDTDQVAGAQALFDELAQELGQVDRILAFNCVLNGVIARARQQQQALGRLFAANRVIGFNTFGEQSGSLHVNQTFTGLAFAAPSPGWAGRPRA